MHRYYLPRAQPHTHAVILGRKERNKYTLYPTRFYTTTAVRHFDLLEYLIVYRAQAELVKERVIVLIKKLNGSPAKK